MYGYLYNIIFSRSYTDLNAMISKVNKAWAVDEITDEQRDTLMDMLRSGEPCSDMDVQDEIQRLWAAVHELQARPVAPATDEPSNEIADWVQPTGAHDAYNIGDIVRYHDKIYSSVINGNVWAPDVYPAGWHELG